MTRVGFIKALFIFSILCFGLFDVSHAQLLQDLPGSNPLQVTVSPQNPRPGQKVTISIRSFSIDLERSEIAWGVDGALAQNGTAQTSFTTIAGKSGTEQTINVQVTSATGSVFNKSLIIRSGDIEILWQSKSYTPPFYKGKALYPIQGDITAVAVPHLFQNGVELNPRELIYAWEKDGKKQQSASGYGKNTIKLPSEFGSKTIELAVTVSSLDGNSVGTRRITITPQNPQIVFYEDSPLYGPIYSNALTSSLFLSSDEIRLRATPYYFSTNLPHSTFPLLFKWEINGTPVDEANSYITLRRTAGVSGTSIVSMSTTNNNKLFQNFKSSLKINFNN